MAEVVENSLERQRLAFVGCVIAHSPFENTTGTGAQEVISVGGRVRGRLCAPLSPFRDGAANTRSCRRCSDAQSSDARREIDAILGAH